MQTYAEMQEQISNLRPSQRTKMRCICGTSKLDAIIVEQVGWFTRVECETNGFRYYVDLGPRGARLKYHVAQI